MQNREKYSCRSDIHTLWHTYRRIKNGQVSHPRAQRSWLPPIPVYNLMCERCALKQKDHCKLCVYTARPNSVTLPLSYWRSAWPSLLDNASVLTVLLAWSHPVSAGGLQNMGTKLKVSRCLCLYIKAFSAVCSCINTGIQNKCCEPRSSLHAWACWYRLLFG